jgi:hypothetical protein
MLQFCDWSFLPVLWHHKTGRLLAQVCTMWRKSKILSTIKGVCCCLNKEEIYEYYQNVGMKICRYWYMYIIPLSNLHHYHFFYQWFVDSPFEL